MKAEFRSDLIAICVTDKIWRLYEPLIFYSNILKQEIIVPKDFFTDFASIRRIPFIYLLCADTAHKAAVIHDYLYKKNCIPEVNRETADKIFNEAMKVSGIWYWRRKIMYIGVRTFGKTVFQNHYL